MWQRDLLHRDDPALVAAGDATFALLLGGVREVQAEAPRAPTPRSSPISLVDRARPGRPLAGRPPPAGRPPLRPARRRGRHPARPRLRPTVDPHRPGDPQPRPVPPPHPPPRGAPPPRRAPPPRPVPPHPVPLSRAGPSEKERSQCTSQREPHPDRAPARPAWKPGLRSRRCRARAGGRPAGRPSRGRSGSLWPSSRSGCRRPGPPAPAASWRVAGTCQPCRGRRGQPRPGRARLDSHPDLPGRDRPAVGDLAGHRRELPVADLAHARLGIGVVGRHKGAWAGR